LEVLRDCLPSSVRRTLRELPESLDETYERILKEIKKPNRDLARRVLQCLVVATRPLRVAELAEVLAVDFDDVEGIPRLKPDWRWEEQELALLSTCSSLIAIVEAGDVEAIDNYPAWITIDTSDYDVEAGDSRIVQFSHFSVKEFLTSSRLATASGEVSNYHIDLEPAHTILAQACLGVLLQVQDGVDGRTRKVHPARYAAEHWTTHAQFGEVLSRLHKGMEYLFDANKPHFKVWLTLYDIDTMPGGDAIFFGFALNKKSPATPLYYAALCGFLDLVKRLITKYPQDVKADGGYYGRPLVAALAGEHFQTADLLRHHGADSHVQGRYGRSPLHSAAISRNLEVVRILIEHDPADVNARDGYYTTPLHWATKNEYFEDGSAARLLLEYGADINAQDLAGRTPLHWAANGTLRVELVRVLLEHGADVEAKDRNSETPLQLAADERHDEVVKLLREHGAK
jgi:Ankyrin repeats (3 copies)/Ankyrin repeat